MLGVNSDVLGGVVVGAGLVDGGLESCSRHSVEIDRETMWEEMGLRESRRNKGRAEVFHRVQLDTHGRCALQERSTSHDPNDVSEVSRVDFCVDKAKGEAHSRTAERSFAPFTP